MVEERIADTGMSRFEPGGVTGGDAKVAFMFAGHGSQWPGMALELLDSSAVFEKHMEACAQALAPHLDWSLLEVLCGERGAPALERVDIVQPALFAVMVSLAALWRSCGVEPAAVAGHSVGEVAAAHVAGALSLEDAARVAALRSRVLVQLSGQGAMVSVPLSAEQLRPRLERHGDRLEIAVITGPSSVVVSGDRTAADTLVKELSAQGVRTQRVAIDYASHSSQVEAVHERLIQIVSWISPRSADIPFYSALTGDLLDTRRLGPEYWYRIERETVRFEQVTRALLDRGHNVLIEISPHPLLTVGVEAVLEDTGSDAVVVGSLRRNDGGPERFWRSLAQAVPAPVAETPGDSRATTAPTTLAQRLATLSEGERRSSVLELVRTEAAVVLGHPSPNYLGTDRAFLDLGFDSLMAVEYASRLSTAIGLRLPTTLVYDHPTPAAIVQYVLERVCPSFSLQTEVGRPFESISELDLIDEMSVEDLIRMALRP